MTPHTTGAPRTVSITLPADVSIARLDLTQTADSCAPCSDDIQTLSLEVADGGGGNYVVIKTKRWAVSEDGILDALIATLEKEPIHE